MQSMTLPSFIAGILSTLFFMAGCLQLGIYIGTTPSTPFELFLPGALTASWPLAVAALLFVLLDIRTHQPDPQADAATPAPPPALLRRPAAPADPAPAAPEQPTYFAATPAPAPATPAPAPAPATTPQATPPPAPATPPRDPSDNGLNFFKV